MSLETPVLFCVFNRPDLTERVFAEIARQQPRQLLVSCDGPRESCPQDETLVRQVRSLIDRVNWKCEVSTLFPDRNRGCRLQMASALTWGFEQHERLIILEDDCLPDHSFFGWCEQLLERFADDERVMMVSGDNFQPQPTTPFSYYFSAYSHIWGWASWRRAWQHYDLEMKSWSEQSSQDVLLPFCSDKDERKYWTDIFDRQHAGQNETWDYSWAYACWKQQGLTVLPQVNLVSNIGFRPDGTHTTDPGHALADKATGSISKLNHPPVIARDTVADEFTWKNIFSPRPSLKPAPSPKKKAA